jgi:hypothetical protein
MTSLETIGDLGTGPRVPSGAALREAAMRTVLGGMIFGALEEPAAPAPPPPFEDRW